MSFENVDLKPGEIINESQVRRLNAMCADFAREGIDAGSLAGSLIGTGVEICILTGLSQERIVAMIHGIIDEVRKAVAEELTPEQIMDRYEIKRSD